MGSNPTTTATQTAVDLAERYEGGTHGPAFSAFQSRSPLLGRPLAPGADPAFDHARLPRVTEDLGELLAGRYRILAPIGRGGMGTVWRAWDSELDRTVAIKELRVPEHVGAEERRVFYARMEREARAAGRLKHSGIITVYDRVAGDDGRPWIVMEYIEGGSLQDRLAEEDRLPAGRVARIGAQMLAGLRLAHRQGIVHRDVKPANVLLEGDRVVLTDFGIAALDGDVTLTQSGAIMGTPAFMAPEQVRGKAATPESDL